MKLLTPEIVAALPTMGSIDDVPTTDQVMVAKFFDPCGRGTWYACAYDVAENTCFGFCVSPLGPDCDEWGYWSMTELASVRNHLGLGIERDTSWRPTKFSEVPR